MVFEIQKKTKRKQKNHNLRGMPPGNGGAAPGNGGAAPGTMTNTNKRTYYKNRKQDW